MMFYWDHKSTWCCWLSALCLKKKKNPTLKKHSRFRSTGVFPICPHHPMLWWLPMHWNQIGARPIGARPSASNIFILMGKWCLIDHNKIHLYYITTLTQICSREVNSLRPGGAYMHRQPVASLVQIMAWRQTGAKPLSESMLPYCQLEAWEQTSVKF